MARANQAPHWLLAFSFVVGLVLVAVSALAETVFHTTGTPLGTSLLRIASETGIAFVVASIVGAAFERVLSKQRNLEIRSMLGLDHELKAFGFEKVYANRQQVFDQLFETALPDAKHEVRIIGICISLFKEAERRPGNKRLGREALMDLVVKLVLQGCEFKILLLKRYPTAEDLLLYGLKEADFFLMRERDEDDDNNFWHGKRLKKIANIAFACWIKVLLRLAERTQSYDADERRRVLARLQLREYLSLPSLSLYGIDQKIFVTPYLYRRHCSDVPSFLVAGDDTPLFQAYQAHFDATWKRDTLTTPALPRKFLELLARDPVKTMQLYEKKEKELEAERHARLMADSRFLEDPEYYRIEENAISALVSSLNLQAPEATGA